MQDISIRALKRRANYDLSASHVLATVSEHGRNLQIKLSLEHTLLSTGSHSELRWAPKYLLTLVSVKWRSIVFLTDDDFKILDFWVQFRCYAATKGSWTTTLTSRRRDSQSDLWRAILFSPQIGWEMELPVHWILNTGLTCCFQSNKVLRLNVILVIIPT